MKRSKQLIGIFLAAVILAGMPVPDAKSVYAQEPSAEVSGGSTEIPENTEAIKKTTTVKGLKKSYNKAASSSIKDTITVSPGNGREIRLQYYNAKTGKWSTKKTYTTDPAEETAEVVLEYPNQWKKKNATKWRVYIPATETAKSYTSPEVEIVTKNISSLKLASKSAVIIRAEDAKVLYSKSMNKRLPNASTTKMMTALLVLENDDLNAKVKFSKNAAATPYGCLHTKAGTKFYVKDLLHALLIPSSNDSAAALAEYTGGSISKFARMMNQKAKELGCTNTHFVNPHGLNNSKHYSSAYDLSLIQRENIKNKTYCSIIAKQTYSFRDVKKKKKYKIYTTDDLLADKISGFSGGKTGWTGQAGSCFSGVYTYKGETYIFTVLGSKTSKGRWNDCLKLMKYIRKYT